MKILHDILRRIAGLVWEQSWAVSPLDSTTKFEDGAGNVTFDPPKAGVLYGMIHFRLALGFVRFQEALSYSAARRVCVGQVT